MIRPSGWKAWTKKNPKRYSRSPRKRCRLRNCQPGCKTSKRKKTSRFLVDSLLFSKFLLTNEMSCNWLDIYLNRFSKLKFIWSFNFDFLLEYRVTDFINWTDFLFAWCGNLINWNKCLWFRVLFVNTDHDYFLCPFEFGTQHSKTSHYDLCYVANLKRHRNIFLYRSFDLCSLLFPFFHDLLFSFLPLACIFLLVCCFMLYSSFDFVPTG